MLTARWRRRIIIAVIGVLLTLFVPYGGPMFACWALCTDGADE